MDYTYNYIASVMEKKSTVERASDWAVEAKCEEDEVCLNGYSNGNNISNGAKTVDTFSNFFLSFFCI